MFNKIMGTTLLMCCAAELLTILFKLIQPDTNAKWFGLLLIPIYCLVMLFVIHVFFKKGGQDD
jgi:hypothetical protein